MKRLHLKNGLSVPVSLSEGNDIADNRGKTKLVRYISVYEEPEEGEKPALLFSVAEGGFNHNNVIFADGLTELPWYMVSIAAEIIDNFDQYFNNLNQ